MMFPVPPPSPVVRLSRGLNAVVAPYLVGGAYAGLGLRGAALGEVVPCRMSRRVSGRV